MHGGSSGKSTGARKGSAAAAEEAAQRAFSQRPSLPLDAAADIDAGAVLGRRRLTGAFFIAIDRIRPDPSQPRREFDSDELHDLTQSIARLGILQPIAVRYIDGDDIYQIISGQRRFEAAKAAGLSELPCWVQTPREEEILIRQIVENWQRADLNPFELADALAQLRDANGLTQDQLAEATGKSKGEVSKLLALLELDPAVQKEVRDDQMNRLSKRHLYAVTKLPTTLHEETIRELRERSLNAVDAERLVAGKVARVRGVRKRGAPVNRIHYATKHAGVVLTFRKQEVTTEDIIAALDEARASAEKRRDAPLNIIHPQFSKDR